MLQALAAKCKLRDMEEELVRDLFITNMTDLELQKKFFVEEMDAERVLKTAMAWESGLENQKSLANIVKTKGTNVVSGNKNETTDLRGILDESVPVIKAEPVGAVQRNIPNHTVGRRQHIPNCRNCGNAFTQGHKTRCPAQGQACRKCGKRDHFARVCRSQTEIRTGGATANRGGYGAANPKRMRYIEQRDDLESLLDAGETSHVGAISGAQTEENQERQNTETDMELDDILDDWDDYTILAVAQKKTPRFTIDAIFGKNTMKFMVDTRSPVSFVDEESAE